MDAGQFLQIAVPIIVAIVTAVGTVLIARMKTRQDVGVAITSGFEALTNQLQEERTQLLEMIQLLRLERAESDQKLKYLRRRVARLEDILEKAGIPIPPDDVGTASGAA